MKTAIGFKVQGQMGQTKEQQDKDDTECYRFAIMETKLDPVYVPGATTNKGNKAKSVAVSPAKAAAVPTTSDIKRKPKNNPKGEITTPKKKETKARLNEHGKTEDERLEEYKEAYKKCMIEKGYAVE